MGVFDAMTTAVSGIRAQSYALENISGNIANSQTTAFKRVDTTFADLIPDRPINQAIAGSVLASARSTNTIQGSLQTTGVSTNMAINGSGYFVVAERTGTSGTSPIFGASDLFTRRGDFTLDKDGFLVNGSGYYLKGVAIDPNTGSAIGSSNSTIKISTSPLAAKQTTTIDYNANLPANPEPNSYSSTTGGTRYFDAATLATGGVVSATNSATFVNQSLAGPSITVYNSVGAPVAIQMRWAKLDPATTTPAGTDTWQLYYQSDSSTTTGPQWTQVGTDFTFAANGQLATNGASGPLSFNVDGDTISGVTLNIGTAGLTQFSGQGGQATTSRLTQDGYTAGTLSSLSISSEGRLSGTYSNGQSVPLADIGIVQFSGESALKRRDGGVFEQTIESGPPIVGSNGSQIVGGAVESSNTDIAEEFSKMIVTQQAYSANTRVITTAQQMLSDVINIIR